MAHSLGSCKMYSISFEGTVPWGQFAQAHLQNWKHTDRRVLRAENPHPEAERIVTQAVRIVDVALPLSSSSETAYDHESGEVAELALPAGIRQAIQDMGLQRSAGVIQLVQQQVRQP